MKLHKCKCKVCQADNKVESTILASIPANKKDLHGV